MPYRDRRPIHHGTLFYDMAFPFHVHLLFISFFIPFCSRRKLNHVSLSLCAMSGAVYFKGEIQYSMNFFFFFGIFV
jgi:hypothetical protein